MLRRTDPHTLAGAYALDALGDTDREKFERHLGVCESCRAEAASLRDAAGRLAETTAAVPPPRLRGQVLAEAARTRQQSATGPGRGAGAAVLARLRGLARRAADGGRDRRGGHPGGPGARHAADQRPSTRLRMDETQRSQIAAILNAPDADIMTVRAPTRTARPPWSCPTPTMRWC